MLYTLITGACGGLGGAFVRLLAERGEPLFLTGRSGITPNERAEELRRQTSSLSVQYFPCDLSDETSRRAFFRKTDAEGIRFSRLIYVAGADIQKPFERYTQEKLTFQTRVNFEGAISFTRAVIKRAPLDGNTELLAIGSVSGIYPMPFFALYSATKRALAQFYAALRVELKGRAKVTCVLPGAIPTRDDVRENIRAQGVWGRLAAISADRVAQKSLEAVQKNRRTPVIGFWNRVMQAGTALVPLSWKMRFIEKRWGKTEKDAFPLEEEG